MRKGKSSTETSLERDEHDSAETSHQVLAVSDVIDRMSYHVKYLLLNILHEISSLVQCNSEDCVGQMEKCNRGPWHSGKQRQLQREFLSERLENPRT